MITEQEVRSKLPEKFCKKIKFGELNECWEWQTGCFPQGYGCHGIVVKKYVYKLVGAHRYMFTQLHGALPRMMLVCHTCDNKKCVNPNHLFKGTYRDNSHDMRRKGRESRVRVQGDKHPWAKLRSEDIPIIRSLIANKVETLSAISRRYNVSHGVIWSVHMGRTWKHVK